MSDRGGETPGIGVGKTPTRSHESLRLYLQAQFQQMPKALAQANVYRAGLQRLTRQSGRKV